MTGMDTLCLQCHMERNLELARSLGSDEQALAFARELMQLYLSAPEDAASPWFAPHTARLLNRYYGLPLDRYRQEKIDSNQFVLARMDAIRSRVEQAADPVLAGIQCAILGNYLDFSALRGNVSFEKLDDMLEKALEMELEEAVYARLCRDLAGARKLLYLTDNAGEIGFDRILAEEMAKRWPEVEITFCVRGDIAQNDATRADAQAVGISFPVIDNGTNIPGTYLPALGEQARQALDEADVIFAKGMANVETMYGCGKNVYYAFLVKCQRFVRLFGKELMTPMLVHEEGSCEKTGNQVPARPGR